MNFSSEDFVTVDDVLADVLLLVDDENTRRQSKGYYVSQIQQALEKLSLETFFKEITKDLPMGSDGRIPIPKGCFNLKQVYLFQGDTCDPTCMQNVYHKRNLSLSGSGNVVFSRNRIGHNDAFHQSSPRGRIDSRRGGAINTNESLNNLYLYGTQDGTVMFSPNCRAFQNVRFIYNGFHTEIGDKPIVPTMFREATKVYVVVEALKVRLAKSIGTAEYPHVNALLQNHKNDLEHPFDGKWQNAKHLIKRLDSKHREDLAMYYQSINS